MDEVKFALTVAAFPIAFIGAVVGIASYMKGQYRTKELSDVISAVAVIETKVELFWGLIQKQVGGLIHSPHRELLDSYIERNDAGEIFTSDEVREFSELLQELVENKTPDHASTPGEQGLAAIYQAILLARYGASPLDEFSQVLADRPSGLELFCMEIAA